MPQLRRRHSVPDNFGAHQHGVSVFHWEVDNSHPQPCLDSNTRGFHNDNRQLKACVARLMNDYNLNTCCQSYWTAENEQPAGSSSGGKSRDATCNTPCKPACVRCSTQSRRGSFPDDLSGNALPSDRNRNCIRKTNLRLASCLKDGVSETVAQRTGSLTVQRSYSIASVDVAEMVLPMSPDLETGMGLKPSLPSNQDIAPADNDVRTDPKSLLLLTEFDYINGNTRVTTRGSIESVRSAQRSQETVTGRSGIPRVGKMDILSTGTPGETEADNTEKAFRNQSDQAMTNKTGEQKLTNTGTPLCGNAHDKARLVSSTEESDLQSSASSCLSSSMTVSDSSSDDVVTPVSIRPKSLPHQVTEATVTDLESLQWLPAFCLDQSEDELVNIMASTNYQGNSRTSSPQNTDPTNIQPHFRPPSPLTVQDEEENSITEESDVQKTSFEETNSDGSVFYTTQDIAIDIVTHDDEHHAWSVSQEAARVAPRPSSPITIQDEILNTREPASKDYCSLHKENTPFSHPATTQNYTDNSIKTPKPVKPKLNQETNRPTLLDATRKLKREPASLGTSGRDDGISEPKRNRTYKIPRSGHASYRSECTPVGRQQEVLMKMVMVGDYRVGKSQLLQALCQALSPGRTGLRCTAYRPHEFAELTVQRGGRRIRVKILDTAGQERFRSLTSSYFRGVQGCFLVFNINQKDSFDHIMQWYVEMQQYTDDVISTLLVGVTTPCQSRDDREVTSERALKLADSLQTQYLETTLKDPDMLTWILERMVEEVGRHLPLTAPPPSLLSISPSPSSRAAGVKAGKRRRYVLCAS